MKPTVTIIGAGAVGSALALALHKAEYPIAAVASRTAESAQALARRLRMTKHARTIDELSLPVDGVVIVAVPDDALAGVAEALKPGEEGGRSRATVLHTSGALPAEVLAPLRAYGTAVGSFHPLMLFPKGKSTGTEFAKCPVAVEGDEAACSAALKLARALHAKPFMLPAEKKTVYHIAAVFASNYFVTLLSAVETAGAASGLPPEERLALFEPLVRQTLEAVLRSSPHDALTGPIVRNDRETIRKHLEALTELGDKGLLSLYIELGLATAHLAKEHE